MGFCISQLHCDILNKDYVALGRVITMANTAETAVACAKAVIGAEEVPQHLLRQALDQFINVHAIERHDVWVKNAGYLMPVLWEHALLGWIKRIHQIALRDDDNVSNTYRFRVVQAAFKASQQPTLEDEQDLAELGLSEEALQWLDLDQYPEIRQWIRAGKIPAKSRED
jgi:hypothetical protein